MAAKRTFDFNGIAKDFGGDDFFTDRTDVTWAYILGKSVLNNAEKDDVDLFKLVLWAGDLRTTGKLELDDADLSILKTLVSKSKAPAMFTAPLWAILNQTE